MIKLINYIFVIALYLIGRVILFYIWNIWLCFFNIVLYLKTSSDLVSVTFADASSKLTVCALYRGPAYNTSYESKISFTDFLLKDSCSLPSISKSNQTTQAVFVTTDSCTNVVSSAKETNASYAILAADFPINLTNVTLPFPFLFVPFDDAFIIKVWLKYNNNTFNFCYI